MKLEKDRKFDILGIGDADIDIMVAVKNFPQSGQKSSGKIIGKFPGGMVANLLSSASAFGAKCHGILCTGDDAFGQITLDDLRKRGIDLSGTVIREGEDTYFTTNCISPDGEKRMILCFGNAIYPLELEVSDLDLQNASIVHMTGNHMSLSIPIAKRAKALGCYVSLDLERLQSQTSKEQVSTLLSFANIVFPNEEGLFSYVDGSSIFECAHRLLNMGPEIVVVTEGSRGAEVFTKDFSFQVPAFKTNVVDTTGAGDTFNGAFLACLCKNMDLQTSLYMASAASSLQITQIGSRTKLISFEDARQICKAKALF